VRSGPGEARTILLFHIISVRPSKQPLMVRTLLKVYMELGSHFLFPQEQIKDIIIIFFVLGSRCRMLLQIIRVDVCAARLSKFMQGFEEKDQIGTRQTPTPVYVQDTNESPIFFTTHSQFPLLL
jgi:hypothetical protein